MREGEPESARSGSPLHCYVCKCRQEAERVVERGAHNTSLYLVYLTLKAYSERHQSRDMREGEPESARSGSPLHCYVCKCRQEAERVVERGPHNTSLLKQALRGEVVRASDWLSKGWRFEPQLKRHEKSGSLLHCYVHKCRQEAERVVERGPHNTSLYLVYLISKV
jgi:hypothetical protein